MAGLPRAIFIKSFRNFSTSSVSRQHLLKTTHDNGIYRIVLSSPKTRNALSKDMLEELTRSFALAVEDNSLHGILLSAEGHVFSAGHNLKEMTADKGREAHEQIFSACTRLMQSIASCGVPVVAQVRGVAAAAGCQLAAMCDIVVASASSKFSTPGVNLGLFCSTPGIAVVRAVPSKVASYMLFTGDSISAEEALRAGLVSKVVPDEQLDSETEKILDNLRSKSRPVLRLGKKFLRQQISMDLMAAFREGEKVMVDNIQLADTQEGIQSFIKKRHPVFKHEE